MSDLISRADAIYAVCKLCVDGQTAKVDGYFIPIRDALENVLKALPSADAYKGDLISRQWLLEVYGDYIGDNGDTKYHVPLEVVRQNIKDAPSADAVSREDWSNLVEEYNNTIGAIMAVISAPTGIKEISYHFAELIKEEQADSVVRCKDCRHAYFKDFDKCCPYMVGALKPDGYCHHGERREP